MLDKSYYTDEIKKAKFGLNGNLGKETLTWRHKTIKRKIYY